MPFSGPPFVEERPPLLTIACRFVPYDQWLITHIDPTWKIKQVKLWILSKCLDRLPLAPFAAAPPAAATTTTAGGAHADPESGADGPVQIGVSPQLLQGPVMSPPMRKAYKPASPITFAAGGGGHERVEGEGGRISPLAIDEEAYGGIEAEADGQGEQQQEQGNDNAITEETKTKTGEDDGRGYEEDDEWDTEDGAHPNPNRDTIRPLPPPPPGGRVPPSQSQSPRQYPMSDPSSPQAMVFKPTADPSTTDTPTRPPAPTAYGRGGYMGTGPLHPASNQQTAALSQAHIKLSSAFALVRFSTGQILEEDFQVAWYDVSQNELFELHGGDTVLSRIKRHRPGAAGSAGVAGVGGAGAGSAIPSSAAAVAALNSSLDPFQQLSSLGKLQKERERERLGLGPSEASQDLPRLRVIRLNRNDLEAYIVPYWEGWVRALRVVWKDEYYGHGNLNPYTGSMVYKSGGTGLGIEYIDPEYLKKFKEKEREKRDKHKGGTASILGQTVANAAAGGAHDSKPKMGSRRTKLEWRDRWVVIKDGMLILAKDRNDPNPSHRLSLTALTSLRGAEHLAKTSFGVRHRVHPLASGTSFLHHKRSKTFAGIGDSGAGTANAEGEHKPSPYVGKYSDYVDPNERDLRIVCAKFRVTKTRSGHVAEDASKPVSTGAGASSNAAGTGSAASHPIPAVVGPGDDFFGTRTTITSTVVATGAGSTESKPSKGHGVMGSMGLGMLVGGSSGKSKKEDKDRGKGREKEALTDGRSPASKPSGSGINFLGIWGKDEDKSRGMMGLGKAKSKDKGKSKEKKKIRTGLFSGSSSSSEDDRDRNKAPILKTSSVQKSLLEAQSSSVAAGKGGDDAMAHDDAASDASQVAFRKPPARRFSGFSSERDRSRAGDQSVNRDDGEGTEMEEEAEEQAPGVQMGKVSSIDSDATLSSPVFAPTYPRRLQSDPASSDDDSFWNDALPGPHKQFGFGYGYRERLDREKALRQREREKERAREAERRREEEREEKEYFRRLAEKEEIEEQRKIVKRIEEARRKAEEERIEQEEERRKKGRRKDDEKRREREREKEREEEERRKKMEREKEKEKEMPKKEEARGEWIVLDLGSDEAYHSILRILHRHAPLPISSSFLHNLPIQLDMPKYSTTANSHPSPPASARQSFSAPNAASTTGNTAPSTTGTDHQSVNSPSTLAHHASNPFGSGSTMVDSRSNLGHRTSLSSAHRTSSAHSHSYSDPQAHLASSTASLASPRPESHPAPPTTTGRGSLPFVVPYPEWRRQITERARKAGLGNMPKPMEWWMLGKCEEGAREEWKWMERWEREEKEQAEREREREGESGSDEGETRRKSSAELNGERVDGAEETNGVALEDAEETDGFESDGDGADDAFTLELTSDDGSSDEEESEAEWKGWVMDLPRQARLTLQREHDGEDYLDDREAGRGEQRDREAYQRQIYEERVKKEPQSFAYSSSNVGHDESGSAYRGSGATSPPFSRSHSQGHLQGRTTPSVYYQKVAPGAFTLSTSPPGSSSAFPPHLHTPPAAYATTTTTISTPTPTAASAANSTTVSSPSSSIFNDSPSRRGRAYSVGVGVSISPSPTPSQSPSPPPGPVAPAFYPNRYGQQFQHSPHSHLGHGLTPGQQHQYPLSQGNSPLMAKRELGLGVGHHHQLYHSTSMQSISAALRSGDTAHLGHSGNLAGMGAGMAVGRSYQFARSGSVIGGPRAMGASSTVPGASVGGGHHHDSFGRRPSMPILTSYQMPGAGAGAGAGGHGGAGPGAGPDTRDQEPSGVLTPTASSFSTSTTSTPYLVQSPLEGLSSPSAGVSRRASTTGLGLGLNLNLGLGGGSLGRSSSVLSRTGIGLLRRDDTDNDREREQERDGTDPSAGRTLERPKLSLATGATLGSSSSVPEHQGQGQPQAPPAGAGVNSPLSGRSPVQTVFLSLGHEHEQR